MTVKTILRIGDPRLWQHAHPVTDFGSDDLRPLIEDMQDTMQAAGGVGLAAPQIGVGLQVVIFGFQQSIRYPDAESVPETILINPVITPLDDEMEVSWEGCLSVPGLRGMVPVSYTHLDVYKRQIVVSAAQEPCRASQLANLPKVPRVSFRLLI